MNNIKSQYEQLRMEILKIEDWAKQEMEEIEDRAQDNIQEFKDKINKLQTECPHENVNFYPDAAGGSGGFYECEGCHKLQGSKF